MSETKKQRDERLAAMRERRQAMRTVEIPADLPGFRPLPLALADQLSVCDRCWSVVLRFHQESHDQAMHAPRVMLHREGCPCGACP